jgi:hypothetical protein
MSIDLETEDLLPMSRAAKLVPVVRRDKTPHPATLVRWATSGILSPTGQRVKLESVFVGGTRMTSKEALKRFFARRNDADFRAIPESAERERKQLDEQAAEAMQRMRAAGLIQP